MPCFDDDRKRLLEARIGLVEWDREARELIVAITFADSEIEPAPRQEVQGRGLLGQEHRIVPRQHHYGSAEPQRRGARREPRQQGEGGRDLVPAGEVVLNQERAVVAKRFRFDVEIDEVMKALAHRRAGTRAAGLRRTKNSKPHDHSPYSRRAPVLAKQRWRLGLHVGIEQEYTRKGYRASLLHADHPLTLRPRSSTREYRRSAERCAHRELVRTSARNPVASGRPARLPPPGTVQGGAHDQWTSH